jgi:hypothetical protein
MMNIKSFLIGFFILFLLSALLPGQGMSASITGNVKSEDGAFLSGVTVTAVNTGSNAALTVKTDKRSGAFRLVGLAPGFYQVSFDLDGYLSYVASGIHLTAEQSLLLRVQLKRSKISDDAGNAPAGPEAQSPEAIGIDAEKGRFSISVRGGWNYLSVGDSNAYLSRIDDRFASGGNSFEYLHSANDLNVEIGYRIMTRLEVAVGLGLVHGRLLGNDLIGSYDFWDNGNGKDKEKFQVDLDVKTLPLQLVCRYWLNTGTKFLFSVYGAVLFNFASWNMKTEHSLSKASTTDENYIVQDRELADASGQGLGLMAGGRGELKVAKNLFFIMDVAGRFAPVRNFSGQREYYVGLSGDSVVNRGKLWFFEYYDAALGRWIWDLEIGARPEGPGTRNVSSARVDFSGLALRVGLLFRL